MGCEPDIKPYKEFFTALAYTTGGQYVPLRNAKLLSKVIVGGAVEEISLEKLLEEAEQEVEYQTTLGVVDEKELTEAVEKKLRLKGAMTHQLKLNDSNLERASESAIRYSKITKMSDLRKEFKTEERTVPEIEYCMSRPMFVEELAISPIEGEVAVLKLMPESDLHTNQQIEENYTVSKDEINYQQTERLVQKVLNRKK